MAVRQHMTAEKAEVPQPDAGGPGGPEEPQEPGEPQARGGPGAAPPAGGNQQPAPYQMPEWVKRTPWKATVWVRLREVEEAVQQAIVAQNWQLGQSADGWRISAVDDPRHELIAEAQAVLTAILKFIRAAEECLTNPVRRISRLMRRVWDPISGETVMSAYASLHAAERQRVLLFNQDQLMALLPSIHARVGAYLTESDPRRIALNGIPDLTSPGHQALAGMQRQILSVVQQPGQHQAMPDLNAAGTQITPVLGAHQQIAAEAFGAACTAEDMEQTQVKRFRAVLLGTFAGLLVPVAALCATGFMHPALLPMCLRMAASATTGVKGATSMICASGRRMPTSADLPLVLGLGAIGAALSVAKTLAGLSGAGVRYSLSVAQGLLKIALGAITAMLGILLLATQSLPGILSSQAGLLIAAVVFGYAQQIFTGFLDQRAASLIRAASPTTPAAGSNRVGGG
jgi:hypothetical protein